MKYFETFWLLWNYVLFPFYKADISDYMRPSLEDLDADNEVDLVSMWDGAEQSCVTDQHCNGNTLAFIEEFL